MPEAAQSSNFEAIWSTNGIYHLALGLSWGTGQEAIAREAAAAVAVVGGGDEPPAAEVVDGA